MNTMCPVFFNVHLLFSKEYGSSCPFYDISNKHQYRNSEKRGAKMSLTGIGIAVTLVDKQRVLALVLPMVPSEKTGHRESLCPNTCSNSAGFELLQVLLRALRDFNLGKLTADDTGIFMGLLNDIFPKTLESVPRAIDRNFESHVRPHCPPPSPPHPTPSLPVTMLGMLSIWGAQRISCGFRSTRLPTRLPTRVPRTSPLPPTSLLRESGSRSLQGLVSGLSKTAFSNRCGKPPRSWGTRRMKRSA